MRPPLPWLRGHALHLSLLLLVAGVAPGCRPADEIRSYKVPKEAAATSAAPSTPAAEPTPTRMIAAMVEGEQRAWFFKAMGPAEQVDLAAESVHAFFKTIGFDAQKLRPTWQTPEGWQELPGAQMRLATLKVPAGESSLEISVIGLGLADDWDQSVIDNVNRWRGQLNLAAMTAEESAALGAMDLDGRRAVVVDLAGEANAAAMMPPMAGGMASRPAAPQVQSPPATPAKEPIDYTLPKGWRDVGRTSMRVVNARVGEPAAEAVITAMPFPANAPDIASPLANANRWLGENGMPALDDEGLADVVADAEVDGEAGQLFTLISPDHENATLAALVKRGARVWFFKLRGPRATVDTQQDAFRQWLSSVRFNAP